MTTRSAFAVSVLFLLAMSGRVSAQTFCVGDGTGTACPCGNASALGSGEGCLNGTDSGALLSASGNAWVAADTLVLTVSQAVPNEFGIFVQNTTIGTGSTFYNGLLCLGQDAHLIRHYAPPGIQPTQTDGTGSGTNAQPLTLGDFLGDTQPGATVYYQFWYRDNVGHGTGCTDGANFSSGLEVTWALGAPPAADITVLVLEDTGYGVPATSPVSGAVVTLQGTDPTSLPGLTLVTDASGLVTFPAVAGPYTVTAQADIVAPGTTYRVATSLVEISPVISGSPPAGTIGVLLMPEIETSPSVDAVLSGVVTNMPVLTGSELMTVAAVANGPVDFEEHTYVDPITGAYSMWIPSNTPIDCFVVHREGYVGYSSAILASLLQPGVGQAGPGTTLTRDFDFGSSAVVPWNVPVAFTATNIHPALNFSIQLLVEDLANGIFYDFSFFDGYPGPSSITLPDITDPSFAGYGIEIDADTFDMQGNLSIEQDIARRLMTTPAAITFDLFQVPSILQPGDLSLMTLSQFNNLAVQVVETSTGAYGDNGFDFFYISTEDSALGSPPTGIDFMEWNIITAPGTTGFQLPLYSLPMFGPTQDVVCGFEQYRQEGSTLDYDTFFDGNLAANFLAMDAAVTGESSSAIGIQVFLIP